MDMLTVIVFIICGIFIFFALREVVCWYFKINDRIELLKKINQKLGPDPEPEKKVKKWYN